MDVVKVVEIKKIKQDRVEVKEDLVVEEYPLTIFINNQETITLLITPKSIKELTVGFLISEGFFNDIHEISDISLMEDKGCIYITSSRDMDLRTKLHGKRLLTTGCGKGTSFYNVLDTFNKNKIVKGMEIEAQTVIQLTREFNEISELFQQTGGVHCVGLSDGERILWYEEDIGRHNALDKVLGKGHLCGMDFKDKILLTTGRISSEILIKAAKRRIPIIISRSAPTKMAIDLAKEMGICIVGFVRGEKMNIYSSFPSIVI